MVYVYMNRVAENILKDKMMQRHFERKKKYEEDEKTGESIDSETRKKKLMKSLGVDKKTRE